MKKVLSIIVFVALCLAYPLAVKQSQATVYISTNNKTGPCSTVGYTRTTSNLCLRTVTQATALMITTGACSALSALQTVPSDALLIIISIQPIIRTSNVVANRTINTAYFTNNTCTNFASMNITQYLAREAVAVGGAIPIMEITGLHYTTTLGVGDLWYKITLTNCINCTQSVQVMGFYD